MTTFNKIAIFFLTVLFLGGAGSHLFNPALSDGFIPSFLPKKEIHYLAAFVELGLAIGLLFPKTRTWAAWGIIGLLTFFLLLHIQDLFREMPVIGSKMAAIIRIPFQLIFIYFAWKLRK
jgi:uncharacterized membrane protein